MDVFIHSFNSTLFELFQWDNKNEKIYILLSLQVLKKP